MKTGYIRFNGVDEGKITRESKHLKEAGCEEIIVEKIAKDQEPAKLDAYLTGVKAGDELIVCSSGSLSRKIAVLVGAIQTLKDAKAKLVILDRSVDFDDPAECLKMTLLLAHQELEEQLLEQEQ